MADIRKPHHIPVACADQEPRVLIGQLGFTGKNIPAVYFWCKYHRDPHACTLPRILETFRQASATDSLKRQRYLSILNQAILDLQAEIQQVEPEQQTQESA